MNFMQINWKDVLTPKGLLSILQGCANHILVRASDDFELVKSVQSYRLDMICAHCPINNDGQCDPSRTGTAIVDFRYHDVEDRKKGEIYSGCSCYLKCKTANMHEQCPLGKWLEQ